MSEEAGPGLGSGRHGEEPRGGGQAAELEVDGGHDGAAGIGDGGGLEAAAGDDAGDVRAVAVGVNCADRPDPRKPGSQVGVVRIHARVIDVDEHIAARQAEIVVRA